MLADAVLAESYRLLRSRTTWFWSVLFVPLLMLVVAVIGNTTLKMMAAGAASRPPEEVPPQVQLALNPQAVDLGARIVEAAGDLANPMVLLFVLIGAATLYAGDYRWETWRLISARNGRTNLILGKVGTLKALTLVAMAAVFVAALGQALIKAAILGLPISFSFDGGDAGQTLALFLLSFWRIVQFTMLGLLAAVLTRSLLAALFVPLVIGVAQGFSPILMSQFGVGPDHPVVLLINPGGAVDIVKALLGGGTAAAMLPASAAPVAFVSLALWMFLPLVAALVWFGRQDLSKE
jgi:ABC-2 type transport system permease protein